MKANVFVTLKEAVLDPQGKAVQGALNSLGFGEVTGVRVGKFIQVSLNGSDRGNVEERVRQMCEKLLANTIIETFKFEIEE